MSYERDYEDTIAESRIETYAELIKDGAHITLGRLSLADHQLQKVSLTRDPLFSVADTLLAAEQLGYDERVHHKVLDQTIAEKWAEMFPAVQTNARTALQRGGVMTLRDLLVVGRAKTSSIEGIGEKGVERVAALLEASNTGFAWKDEPTVEDIASVCDSLDQINGLVILDKRQAFATRMTIADILLVPKEDRAEALGRRNSWHEWANERIAKRVYDSAEVFALQFDLATNGMWTNPRNYKEFPDNYE